MRCRSNHNFQLSTQNSQLSLAVEVLLECREFRLSSYAAFPPCLYEAEAVAHQLCVGGGDAEDADVQTVVLASRVSADDEAVEGEGDERQPSQGGAEEE